VVQEFAVRIYICIALESRKSISRRIVLDHHGYIYGSRGCDIGDGLRQRPDAVGRGAGDFYRRGGLIQQSWRTPGSTVSEIGVVEVADGGVAAVVADVISLAECADCDVFMSLWSFELGNVAVDC